jgi:type VI secretion system protein ImpA
MPPVPAVIDLEALLAPIPGDNPAGENLRYDGTHDLIKEARRADEALAQGEWERELKVAEWPKVIEIATQALAKKAKDLQVGAWLAEALVKNDQLDRFAGLRDGLKLIRQLQELFWDHLFPEIDPEDDEGPLRARANVLEALDNWLAVAIKEVPLTNSAMGLKYSYLQWEGSKQFEIPENLEALSAEEQERANELKARAAAEGKITSEDWRKAYRTTPRAFYEERYQLLNECWEEVKALDRTMDDRLGRETPGLKALQKSLDEIRSLVERLVKEKRIAEPYPEEVATAEGASEAGAEVTLTGEGAALSFSTGPVRSRKEALKRLAEVAEYFRRTEPHSPVSYLVQRAINWGNMPLEVWLRDVIKDDNVLNQLRETLGIKAGSDESSE